MFRVIFLTLSLTFELLLVSGVVGEKELSR